MRTGAAAGHKGYFHEAMLYRSQDELLSVVLPFLRGGLAADEPTVVAFGERNGAAVRAALSAAEVAKVVFHAGNDMYARPAGAIRSYRSLLHEYTEGGANQIRIIGELPAAALGVTWDWWARYESAVNHAYNDYPLWSMCAYDVRTTPAAVLDDVVRTHPRVAAPDGSHLPSEQYVEPTRFLSQPQAGDLDPLQLVPPAVELVDPAPSEAREMVAYAGVPVLGDLAIADLALAVSEIVTNGLRHGEPPVVVRCWAGDDRLVITVTDQGRGPSDPFAGLQPAAHAPFGGLGLWLTHQLADHVALQYGPDDFTVRLIAGNPYHRA
jgi:anti-sigma regulatory factor (Ser/Thr protein kinase)